MTDFTEKRDYFRIRVDCDIHCKRKDSDEIHVGRCTTLSGGGVSFITTQELFIGEKVEITIHPQHNITPSMTGMIEIVRVIELETKEFEIGAIMQVLTE